MSYEQRIYEDFDDYKDLTDLFDDYDDLADWFQSRLDVKNINYLVTNSQQQTFVKNLVIALAYPIYDMYCGDKVAYNVGNINGIRINFLDRIIDTIVHRINKWYLQHKIDDNLFPLVNLTNFTITSEANTNTGESGVSGSVVEQESASTPTGITHDDSGTTDMQMEIDGDSVEISTESGYLDKYTNFMGKTQGVKKNVVDRNVESTRSGNYILAMDLLKAIPYSYINEVLMEVSKHFIQVY